MAPSTKEPRVILRIGGAAVMLGVLTGLLAAMLGPMDLPSHDMGAVLAGFATDAARLRVHGLGVSVGALLVLAGLATLARAMPPGPGRIWASLGLAMGIAKTGLHLVGGMMGGSVLPAVAAAHAAAPAGHEVAALQAGATAFIFYEALLAPTFLTLGATVLLFALAVRAAGVFPAWLGWAATVPVAWTLAGGVAFILAGPLGAADIMLALVPGFMLAMIYLFILGLYLWQRAPVLVEVGRGATVGAAADPAADPSTRTPGKQPTPAG
jgi:hypothetical protein